MKRMTEGRGSRLCEGGAQSARIVRKAAGITVNIDTLNAGEMAEFMNDRALLRGDQQQHEKQCLAHLSHLIRNHFTRSHSGKLTESRTQCSIHRTVGERLAMSHN